MPRRPSRPRPSTRCPEALPDPEALRALGRTLALLDAALEPDEALRQWSFDPAWAPGEALVRRSTGEGDGFVLWFGPAGAFLRGSAPQSPVGRAPSAGAPDADAPEGLPAAFAPLWAEPAWASDPWTFLLWREAGASAWSAASRGGEPGGGADGSEELLDLLDGDPKSFLAYARAYHEVEPDPAAVRALYARRRPDEALLRRIAPGCDAPALLLAAERLGFHLAPAAPAAPRPARPSAAVPAEDPLWEQVFPGGRRPGVGAAQFRVMVLGDTVKMVVHGKAVASAEDPALYRALFALVKGRIDG